MFASVSEVYDTGHIEKYCPSGATEKDNTSAEIMEKNREVQVVQIE